MDHNFDLGYWPDPNDHDNDRDGDTQKCCLSNSHCPWPSCALKLATQANLADKIVTIKVGSGNKQTTFQWLKPILEFHSPFFIGAFERSFKEPEKREIELPEDDSDVFAEFMRWVIDHRLGYFGPKSKNPDLGVREYHWLLARLYIFADKYNMPRLQNVVINAIIDTLGLHYVVPEAETVNHIYQNTKDSRTSPLCRILVNYVALTEMDLFEMFSNCEESGTPYCLGFTTDVLYKYSEQFGKCKSELPSKDWLEINRCSYHVPVTELKD